MLRFVQALKVPEKERQQLMIELALTLYDRGILSFGKACELCQLTRIEFGQLLGRPGIPRHYTEQDLNEDIDYARGE